MYVTLTYEFSTPNVVSPRIMLGPGNTAANEGTPTKETLFHFPYDQATDYKAAANALPNNNYGTETEGYGPKTTHDQGVVHRVDVTPAQAATAAAQNYTAPTPYFHPSSSKVGASGSNYSSGNAADYNGGDGSEVHSPHNRENVYVDSVFNVETFGTVERSSGEEDDDDEDNDDDEDDDDEKDMYPKAMATPTSRHVADMVAFASSGHFWGYGTCEWIHHCNWATQLPGAMCRAANHQGQAYAYGYCFESDTGSLECGRMIDIDDEHRQNKRLLHETQRCPRRAPVRTSGRHEVKRLLIGGCMDPADTLYDDLAEVHVPDSCRSSKANWKQGCMFPGAENFDADAKQPGKCEYLTEGCMDSNALNYNSEANQHVPNDCVLPTYGCSISGGVNGQGGATAYSGIDAGTPNYKGLTVGVPLRHVGQMTYPEYPSVVTTDATANTLDGSCVVAVEGCMDSTSPSYDAKATVNTNTWCIPSVTDCMMPATGNSGAANNYQGATDHSHQGLALNFNPAATINNVSACVIQFEGCTDPTAINYNSHATDDDGSCFASIVGCLDRNAQNFNCTLPGVDDGTVTKQQALKCNIYASGGRGVTVHSDDTCAETVPPPPSPPPPTTAGPSQTAFTSQFVIAGDLTSFSEADKAQFCANMDALLGVSGGVCVFTQGSVVASYTVIFSSDAERDAAVVAAGPVLASSVAASAFLGITVVSVSYSVQTYSLAPPSAPPSSDTAAIAGGVVGGVVALALAAGLAFWVVKKKGNKATAASSTTVAPQ